MVSSRAGRHPQGKISNFANKTSMSARSSPTKMEMWDQEELLRCCVRQRNHKSDFGKTNPILPQAQETKTHLSAMTVYFCSAGLGVFFARPAAFRIPTLPTVPGSGSRPAPSTLMNLAKQSQFFLKLKKSKHLPL